MDTGGAGGEVAMPWASVLERADGQGIDMMGEVVGVPGGRMEDLGNDRGPIKMKAQGQGRSGQQQLQVRKLPRVGKASSSTHVRCVAIWIRTIWI